jgi:hypothetical protein
MTTTEDRDAVGTGSEGMNALDQARDLYYAEQSRLFRGGSPRWNATEIAPGQALCGAHGELGEFVGLADYCGTPGVQIRRRAWVETLPASAIGTTWIPVSGRVVMAHRATGRWTTSTEAYLTLR